jgi:6,7-dimethyl-8-ribityllumazine synthase
VKTAPSEPPDGRGLRVALLRSRFNEDVVDGLTAGAQAALVDMGVAAADIATFDVPGAFELPLAAAAAADSGKFDAVVALGAVIRGDTDHYEHIAREAAAGIAAVALEKRLPVAFGVLTVDRIEQAQVRAAAGPGNKGGEAARAAVAMAVLLRKLRS